MTIHVGDQLVHNLDCDFPAEQERHRLVGLARHVGIRRQDRADHGRRGGGDLRHDRIQPTRSATSSRSTTRRCAPSSTSARCAAGTTTRTGCVTTTASTTSSGRATRRAQLGQHVLGPRHQPRHGPLDRAGPRAPPVRRQRLEPPSVAWPIGECFSGSGNVDLLQHRRLAEGQREDDGAGVHRHRLRRVASPTRPTAASRGPTTKATRSSSTRGRDPKLIWYAPGKHWVIALFDERAPYGQNISIYTSKDLKAVGIRQQHPRLLRVRGDLRTAGGRQPGEQEVGDLRRGRQVCDRAFRRQEVHARARGQAPGPLGRLLRLAMLQQQPRRTRGADRLGAHRHARACRSTRRSACPPT